MVLQRILQSGVGGWRCEVDRLLGPVDIFNFSLCFFEYVEVD